jgi:hypothetical protein
MKNNQYYDMYRTGLRVGWDDFVNFSFRPIPSHPIPSHVIPWDGMGQYTHQISFIKNKIS